MQGEPEETELVWSDKETVVNPPILPFQTIETVNEPRISEKPLDFGSDNYPQDWKNKLIWGDNKYVLSSLKQEYEGQIDLIYIDPPFATGADFSIPIEVGDESVTKEPSVIEELAYRDTWGSGLQSYLQMMYERLVLMRELLSEKGSIWVHGDWRVSHYVKVIMDEIFGRNNFVNNITWCYAGGGIPKSAYPRKHDDILFYTKNTPQDRSNSAIEFEPQMRSYSKTGSGRRSSGAKYDVESGETPHNDWWTDIPQENTQAKSNTGYPTQKPEDLLTRIIKTSTNQGALVADFFCGSGTTGAVAEKLDRRWLVSDLSKFAIQTTRKRLLNIHNYSKDYDKRARPFEILNLGNYQKYKFTENGHPPVEEYRDFILELYESKPIEGYSFLHGRKGSTFIHIASVDGIVTEDEVKDATEECSNSAGGEKLDVLGWDFEMGLDRMVGQIGEMYGVDVNLKIIPKEATEIKNAAEEGDHVKFFDLNYVEVDHQVQVEGSKLNLEITDFVLANPEYIPGEVRESIDSFTDYIDYWAVDFDYQDDTFHNMWQTFRTRDRKRLETSCAHDYEESGTKKVLVKVIDVFGNDTNKLLEVNIND